VEILEAERRRIHKVRVHRLEPEAELEGGGAES
jgi:CBS domain containing-hemolysin-like protein